MKKLLLLAMPIICSLALTAQDTTQHIVPDRKNSPAQQNKPYVILISADGFRYDYADRFKATHLQAFAAQGVKASSMIPSWPSSTYPNHYALATGLYPAHHGIVQNIFYDRDRKRYYNSSDRSTYEDGSWYGGTPIWVLAEQQHMLAASFYWVGSDAAIKGMYSTYHYTHGKKIPIHRRIQIVVDWLKLPADRRPHLITFYLPQPDDEGHEHGPLSPQVERDVHYVDSVVYELNKAVNTTGLDVNFIFVSDHGMSEPDTQHPLPTPAALDTTKFFISGDRMVVQLIAKDPADIQPTYEGLKKSAKEYDVYLRKDIPAHLHSAASDDRFDRIGDILLMPHFPKLFNIYNRKLDRGQHGYDPMAVKKVHATFYAWGPAFKRQMEIPPFPNVNIYPLVAHILGLTITDRTDGNNELGDKVLANPQ